MLPPYIRAFDSANRPLPLYLPFHLWRRWPTQLLTLSYPVPTAPASLRARDEVLELDTKTNELQDEVAQIQSHTSTVDQRCYREKVKIT
jgi:hypothetical protein